MECFSVRKQPRRRRLFARSEGGDSCFAIALPLLCVFFVGGLPYGISALFPVLFSEGVFVEQCGAERAEQCQFDASPKKCCDTQVLTFTLLSSVAMLPSDALVALYGEFVDRRGPRKTFLVGMAFALSGLALLALNARIKLEALWYASFFCIGACGPGVFFSVLFLTEKHPTLQALIPSLASATNDASAISFFLFNVLYFDGHLSLTIISVVWCCISCVLGAATVFQLPSWGWLKRERQTRDADSGRCSDGGSGMPEGHIPAIERGASHPTFAIKDVSPWSSTSDDAPPIQPSPTPSRRSQAGVSTSSSLAEPLLGKLPPPPPEEEDQSSTVTPVPGTPVDPFSRALHARWAGTDASDSVHGGGAFAAAAVGATDGLNNSSPGGGQPSNGSEREVGGRAEIVPTSRSKTAPSTIISRAARSSRVVDQIYRKDTLLLIAMMSVANLKATWFIVSFSDRIQGLFASETAARLDTMFNVGFPIGSLVTSPLTTLLLRRQRHRPDIYMGLAWCAQVAFGACALIPTASAQAAAALLFGPTRTLLWSSHFHYLAQPRRYPRKLAGRTLGYANLLIALASDLPLYGLGWLVRRTVGTTIVVDAVLEAVLLCCAAFPLSLFWEQHRRESRT